MRLFHDFLLMQIIAMSTMKDHERLELLKEIGGTKVYEERRKESLKILHETDNRRSRILEVVILQLSCHAIRICCVMAVPFFGSVGISGHPVSSTKATCVGPTRRAWMLL